MAFSVSSQLGHPVNTGIIHHYNFIPETRMLVELLKGLDTDVDNSSAYVYNKRKTLSLIADYINQLLLPGIEMLFIARLFHSCPLRAFYTFQKACYVQDTNFAVRVNL